MLGIKLQERRRAAVQNLDSDREPSSSFRDIIRSSSIIGGASAINVAVGILRLKFAAILLGPGGVGLIGLYQNMISAAATVASLGIGGAGTRQIAEARSTGNEDRLATVRRALFWLTIGLACSGMLTFYLVHEWIAEVVLQNQSLTGTLAWLSLGVGFGVAASSQGALLLGMRRVGDNARVSVLSALAGGGQG